MPDSEELLVRFTSASIRFPEVCPICGEPAVRKGILLTSLRIRSNHRFNPRSGFVSWTKQPPTHIRKGLDIPICEKHYLSDLAKKRIRGPSSVCGGLLVFFLLFVSVNIVFRLMDNVPVNPYWYVLFILSSLFSIISLSQLSPSEVNKAVSIRKVEIGSKWIILKLKHLWYLDELLRLNPENAKRVSILRSERQPLE